MLRPSSVSSVSKVSSTLKRFNCDQGLPFLSAVDGPILERALTACDPDFRERVFSPDITLMAFCSQLISADGSCRQAVARTNAERLARGLPECSQATSAYCQARARLPLSFIENLARQTAVGMEQMTRATWLWRGRHIKLLDGTAVTMSDTPENQKQWPQNPTQKPGAGFPIMRVVALISLATAAVCDLAFAPYTGEGTGEQTIATELLASLNRGDIILADRAFAGYFFIALTLQRGGDIVTRLHQRRSCDFKRGEHLGRGDHVIELIRPPRPKWMDQDTYDTIPTSLKLREVDTAAKDREGKKVIVVTTLTDPKKYSRTELAGVSKLRWHIELDLRSIKDVMGMDMLSCKSPAMVKKEVWAYVLAYNLVRQLIFRAAERHGLEPRQISFTGAVQTLNAFMPILIFGDLEERKKRYEVMLKLIAQMRIGNRPGRREPRAVKRRKKNYDFLNKPRADYKNAEGLS